MVGEHETIIGNVIILQVLGIQELSVGHVSEDLYLTLSPHLGGQYLLQF